MFTDAQGTDPQLDELRAAGCEMVLEEYISGADRSRPVLARLLWEIRPGEPLVVVRLDRLARSVSHLLAVIEQLEGQGAHFRSRRDPIDTSTPQGMFSLQVLGAVALPAAGETVAAYLASLPPPRPQPRRARARRSRDRRSEAPAWQPNGRERFRVRQLVGSG